MKTVKKYLTDFKQAFEEMKKKPVYFQEIRGVYYQNIEGQICSFDARSDALMTGPVEIDWTSCGRPFVLEESAEDDIGKLCWFWDNPDVKHIGILKEVLEVPEGFCRYRQKSGCLWQYYQRVSNKELKEMT